MGDWWIEPQWTERQLAWFGGLLAVSVALAWAMSGERRRRLGTLKFLLGYLSLVGAPLFGVVVVRAAFRMAFEEAGRGWWTAMWLSLFWMLVFVTVAQWLIRRVPPTRGWLRDYRQAGRDIWRERLQRWFGFRLRR